VNTPLRPSGGDIGNITTMIVHESNAAWAANMQKVQADPAWMDLVGRVMADPPAEQVESSLFVDLDAYGEFADQQGADEQFQNFWMEVSANPSADLIRSGIYMNLG